MISTRTAARWRLAFFGLMYVAQGATTGLFTVSLVMHLLAQGVPATIASSVFALVGVPWMLAFAWGPLIDARWRSRFSRRKTWMLIGACGCLVVQAALIAIADDTQKPALLGLLLLVHGVFGSLLDTAVDAFSIRVVEREEERGKLAAAISVGDCIGFAFGTVVLGHLLVSRGYRVTLMCFAAIFVVAALAIMIVPEPRPSSTSLRARFTIAQAVESALSLLRQPQTQIVLAIIVLTEVANSIVTFALSAHFIARHAMAEVTLMSARGGHATLIALFAGIGAGVIADRVGAERVLASGFAVATVVLLALSVVDPTWSHTWQAHAIVMVTTALSSVAFVTSVPLFMRQCSERYAGTQLSLLMCLYNVASIMGTRVSAALVEGAVAPAVFVVCCAAAFGLAAIAALRYIAPAAKLAFARA